MYKKVCLKPNAYQAEQFKHFSDVNRYVHNAMFTLRQTTYNTTRRNTSVTNCINFIKDLNLPWMSDVPYGLIERNSEILEEQYKRFFRERTIKAHPDYWKKHLCKPMFSLQRSNIRLVDNKHVEIEGINGYVRCNTVSFENYIFNVHITFDKKHWYLVYEYYIQDVALHNDPERIGIDLGLGCLAICSDMRHFYGTEKEARVLKLEAKRDGYLQAIERKLKYNGCRRSAAVKEMETKISLLERRLENIQKDCIHKITSELAKTTQGTYVIEDLDVKAMMRNTELAPRIKKQGFDLFRRYLEYKCALNGVQVIVANRFFPSSKLCSHCWYYNANMTLDRRTMICCHCGNIIDRDVNAAINLKNYVPDWETRISR